MAWKKTNDAHYQDIADALRDAQSADSTAGKTSWLPSEMPQAVADLGAENESLRELANSEILVVNPTTEQQVIYPTDPYTAIRGVVCNPAQTTDLDNWIARNDQTEPLYIESNATQIAPYACYEQTRLVSFKADNVTSIGNNAFQNCTSLQSVNAQNTTSVGALAFKICYSLRSIDFRNALLIGQESFNTCSALQYVDLRNAGTISTYVFAQCTKLVLIDLTSCATPTKLSNINAFNNTNSSWIAVVSDDTIKAAFQSATNWSTYASHFRTIAEVEAETGMSYDDYYYQLFGHARNEVTA